MSMVALYDEVDSQIPLAAYNNVVDCIIEDKTLYVLHSEDGNKIRTVVLLKEGQTVVERDIEKV